MAQKQQSDRLFETFERYFEIVSANSTTHINEAYSLRYQVYCVENAFEDSRQFPDCRETDHYDQRSAHKLIRYRATGMTAGTVRLVLADPLNPQAPFPLESHSGRSYRDIGLDEQTVLRTEVAEISRFAVSKHFKRRFGEIGTSAGVGPDPAVYESSGDASPRLAPHLTLGLFAAIVQMSAENGVKCWYAVMEPALLRLLSRFGIVFQNIGEVVSYHGQRQPCFGFVDEVLAGIWCKRPEVWRLITNGGRTWPAPRGPMSAGEIHRKLH